MRPSKEQYYLNIAKEVVKIGALIVKEDAIVATGYVGAPRKTSDCLERGVCLRDKLQIPHGQRYELCRSVHAEQNCIINSARAGVSLLGGDMYQWSEDKNGAPIDSLPCFICKKMIINAGIKRVVAGDPDGDIIEFKVKDWLKDEAYMTYGNKKSGKKIQKKEAQNA
mgnify:CR=1 FL=1